MIILCRKKLHLWSKNLIMKQIILLCTLFVTLISSSQSTIQTVNSGSIIGTLGSVSVGEIVVVPVNQSSSSSGIIGILVQTLEVPQLELSEKITVYPNPTTSSIYFQTTTSLLNEKVSIFKLSGQLVSQKQITNENALDLSELSTGVYLIQFANKNIKSFKIIKH
jgi:hypothetical protein